MSATARMDSIWKMVERHGPTAELCKQLYEAGCEMERALFKGTVGTVYKLKDECTAVVAEGRTDFFNADGEIFGTVYCEINESTAAGMYQLGYNNGYLFGNKAGHRERLNAIRSALMVEQQFWP